MSILKRLYPPPKTLQPHLVQVVGKVAIGATGAVGAASGKGFTVTRTGAGLYTITLDTTHASVPAILFADVKVVASANNDTQDCHILTLDAAAKKVTVACSDAGTVDTPADPDSGSFLSFNIVVQNADATQ